MLKTMRNIPALLILNTCDSMSLRNQQDDPTKGKRSYKRVKLDPIDTQRAQTLRPPITSAQCHDTLFFPSPNSERSSLDNRRVAYSHPLSAPVSLIPAAQWTSFPSANRSLQSPYLIQMSGAKDLRPSVFYKHGHAPAKPLYSAEQGLEQNPYIKKSFDRAHFIAAANEKHVAEPFPDVRSFLEPPPQDHITAAMLFKSKMKHMPTSPEFYGFISTSARCTNPVAFNRNVAAYLKTIGKSMLKPPVLNGQWLSFWALFHGNLSLCSCIRARRLLRSD